MNIVMLNGQNHKGSSYNIGKRIIDKMDCEKNVREFFFPRDLNHFCLGCYRCVEDVSACPYFEEKKVILDAIEKADVLVVTTPVYCMHVSAPLKAFIDMTFDYWMVHRPHESMFSKRAVVVATCAGAGSKSAIKDVYDALFYVGVPEIHRYGVPVQAMNWQSVSQKIKDKVEKKTARIAAKLSKSSTPTVGLKTRFMFFVMGMMHKKGWDSSPVEREYWENRGWLDGKRPWKR